MYFLFGVLLIAVAIVGWLALRGVWAPLVPEIETTQGQVTEWARKQAAINMRHDLQRRAEVEELLKMQLGEEKGAKEMRRRYPESFENE